MSKRNIRQMYPHQGFMIRPNKMLSNGAELLYCTERQTSIKCTASGRRENGIISLVKPHTGHAANQGLVNAKVAKLDLKEMAKTTTLAPRDLLHETKTKHGVSAVVMAGTSASLNRLISRAREERCPDIDAVDAVDPVFQGKMARDNDNEDFILFDDTVPQTNGRVVGFGNKLALEVLETSNILLTDGTFAVARAPFQQLWSLHAQFGDSTIPVVHVLMVSRSVTDYAFVLDKLKSLMPNWQPSDYLGDLEIGQYRAVSNAFPGITSGFCYFHLLQSWFRQLKKLKLDNLVTFGKSMYQFWSLLRCLPYGDVTDVEQDFDLLIALLPTPLSIEMTKFIDYMKKYYVGPRPILMFPPSSWNVSSRTIRNLPRTTNAVEALHRNLERCIRDTRGRTTPLLSELLRCLRQEASKLKFDKEALDIDPLYRVSSQRKLKDIAKDGRILDAMQKTNAAGAPLTGLQFLKAIRAAKKYI